MSRADTTLGDQFKASAAYTGDQRGSTHVTKLAPFNVERQPKKVAFLLVPGFSMLAYASALEPLRVANLLSGRLLYQWHHVTPNAELVSASNGVELLTELSVKARENFDYAFVCASDEGVGFSDRATLAWLRFLAARGTTLGAMGGGAFLLARAGLLRGHRITLHWAYAEAFAEEFPEANLQRSLYELDGDRITCGGGISPLDMMHALLGQEHGARFSRDVTDWFVHTEIREGEHAQRSSFQARLGVSHLGLLRVLEAIEQSLEEPLDRPQLAQLAGVSERQLDRLFASQLGTTLRTYYLAARLKRARALLLHSTFPIVEISLVCGFLSASSFSKSYRSHFGVTPSSERLAVRAEVQKPFAPHS